MQSHLTTEEVAHLRALCRAVDAVDDKGEAVMGLQGVLRALSYSTAYIGKAIADGFLDGCAVPAPKALAMIQHVQDIIAGREKTFD